MLLKSKIEKIKSSVKSNNVLEKFEERYCYAFDALNDRVSREIPELVIFVESIQEIQAVVKQANINKTVIVARGAGSNMVGACTCSKNSIIMNFSKMNKILDFDKTNMTMRVQPGVVIADIMELAEKNGLYFPAYPSSYKIATIGGAIAQSSGGAMSLKYGTIKDYVLSLKIVTAAGELLTLGAETIKDATGYHLAQLMVGSEGTLGIITEAVIKLLPKPECKNVISAYFENVNNSIEVINEILDNKIIPAAIDFMDKNSIKTIENYSKCGLDTSMQAMLIIEIDGFKETLDKQKNIILSILDKHQAKGLKIAINDIQAQKLWGARQSSYSATTQLAPDVISEDIIVPRTKLAEMVIYCNDLADKYGLKMCMVGHAGDGNLHPQIALNMDNENEFKKYVNMRSDIYQKAISLGGTISAEHGIGIEKIDFINSAINPNSIKYMKLIKKVFDPNNILNPDKIFKI